MMIEVVYSLIALSSMHEFVMVSYCVGYTVICSFTSSDLVLLGCILMMWPFQTVYVGMLGLLEESGLVMQEMKKVFLLIMFLVVPALMMLVFLLWSGGIIGAIIVMSYTLIVGFSMNMLLLLSVLYMSMIGGYKMLMLGVLPIPMFFGKVGGGMIIFYSMLFGILGWLE